MATRLYLHNATYGSTKPTATTSATTPTTDGLATNGWKTVDTTISVVSQSSASINTPADTNSDSAAIQAWCTAPLAAQTIGAQTITCNGASSEGNANSNLQITWVITLWRPSTTSIVGRLIDLAAIWGEPGTTQTAGSNTTTSTSRTALDGDILVIEAWRAAAAQAMGTSYANTIYFDGTTEGSITNCATYINLGTTTLSFYNPPTANPQLWRQASTQKPYELVAQRRASWW